jgi:hypothetical protein
VTRNLGLDVIQRGSEFAYAELALIHQQGKNAAARSVGNGVEHELSIHDFEYTSYRIYASSNV